MKAKDPKLDTILHGPIFPKLVQITVCIPMGDAIESVWLTGDSQQ